jgi:hypothetical protein
MNPSLDLQQAARRFVIECQKAQKRQITEIRAMVAELERAARQDRCPA